MTELRIIGGKARGRRIKSVPGETTRPVTDKVREALFNIIGSDIQGATFLDLFAGTGSVGIEALSRGAQFACFIDQNRKAINVIRENLAITGFEKEGVVIHADAFTYLERKPNQEYDYIFVAPPQYKGMWNRAVKMIDHHIEWINEDAWVIVQIHPTEYMAVGNDFQLINLIEFDQRHYGSTLLVFYRSTNIENIHN